MAIGVRRSALFGLASVVLLAGCDDKKTEAPPKEPVSVSYIETKAQDVPVTFDFVAQTQSSQQVQIYARINGFLDSQNFEDGALVKAGDVLFKLDQKPQIAELEEAEAALQRDIAAREVARSNLARVKPLAKLNALSQKDLDDAQGRFDMTSATVDGAQATVDRAKLNLSYTVIPSPIDGFAAAANQMVGTYISQANANLTSVSLVTPMWVNFSLSENQLLDLRNQRTNGTLNWPPADDIAVDLILPDGQTFPQQAKVTFTAPYYNPQTGTFQIRGTFDNPEALLKPSQYVTARVKGFSRPNAILVPQRAVHQAEAGHFVWVIDKDNLAEFRPVEPGDWHGDDWFITKGLKPGEKVIVDGMVFAPKTDVAGKPLSAATAQ
jgi:membrane fusion protein (multidrug efflux system)